MRGQFWPIRDLVGIFRQPSMYFAVGPLWCTHPPSEPKLSIEHMGEALPMWLQRLNDVFGEFLGVSLAGPLARLSSTRFTLRRADIFLVLPLLQRLYKHSDVIESCSPQATLLVLWKRASLSCTRCLSVIQTELDCPPKCRVSPRHPFREGLAPHDQFGRRTRSALTSYFPKTFISMPRIRDECELRPSDP